jgi:DNA-binding CsgD family transcriptional regulator
MLKLTDSLALHGSNENSAAKGATLPDGALVGSEESFPEVVMNILSNTAAATGDESKQSAPITVERFSRLIGVIYDAALDQANWSHCLEEMRREFSGNFVSLIVRQGTMHDVGFIVSAAGERRVFEVNNSQLMAMSPFSGLRPGKVVTNSDVISPADWRASQYYQDWCKPHNVYHVMAVNIEVQDGGVYGFRVTRPEGDPAFSSADLRLCEHLLPHLKRALNLHASINKNQQVHSLYRNAMGQLMVGVILLDENGLVLEANAMANRILKLGDGITISANRLGATYPADNRKLQQLIQKALSQKGSSQVSLVDAMSINRNSGQVAWGVVMQSISPDQWTEGKHRPCVAVFLRDPEIKSEPPMRLAQQLFQLTPAETSLAIQLANGLSLDEASEVLNIRRNTARAHLRSIFSKTGVRRQTELVRIFLNSVALLGTGE